GDEAGRGHLGCPVERRTHPGTPGFLHGRPSSRLDRHRPAVALPAPQPGAGCPRGHRCDRLPRPRDRRPERGPPPRDDGDDGYVAPDVLVTLLEFARGCGIQAESLTMPDALVAGFDRCGPYPRIAWYRAVLADLLVQEDRVVYLDSDVLVLHDVGALWGTE